MIKLLRRFRTLSGCPPVTGGHPHIWSQLCPNMLNHLNITCFWMGALHVATNLLNTDIKFYQNWIKSAELWAKAYMTILGHVHQFWASWSFSSGQSMHGPCTVHATTKKHSMHGPCTVPAQWTLDAHSLHGQSLHTPCTVYARSMHGPCTVTYEHRLG